MNIMHIVFSFKSGGIENLLVDTINNWDKKEDTITLCIINDDINDTLLQRIKIEENIKIIRLNRKISGNRVDLFRHLPKIVKKHNIDVIHCHSFSAFKVSAYLKLLNPKFKIVYTVHDTKIFPELKQVERIFVKLFADKVIAISQVVKQDILNVFPYESDVQVIYNGVDFSKFLSRIKPREKTILIGNVARIIPNKKGQDVLIKSMAIVKKQYPDVICYFAGEPPKHNPEYLIELKQLVKELGLIQNVVFLGNCEDVPTFLNKIDIFVLPSRYEGFGIAIIEALAAMKPVIASDLEGPKEILERNGFGNTFPCGNEKELAKQILKEIKTPSFLQHNIYEESKDKFNIKKSVVELGSVYKSLFI